MYNIIKTKYRLGEKRTATNGLVMTIIEYNSAMNISVQFETGEVVRNKTYSNFTRGNIGLPNTQPKYRRSRPPVLKVEQAKVSGSHIGEKVTRPDGTTITIIAFRNCMDIDVQFDDGTIKENVNYDNFIRGNIHNPKKPRSRGEVKRDRIGLCKDTKDHQKMTIIAYRKASDLDVQFDDGTIVYHRTWQMFDEDKIQNPNKPRKYCYAESKIGETMLHHLGISMKIIDYKNTDNITVQFDSGYQKHSSYRKFKDCKIGHAFPYTMGDITLIQPAYVFNGVGNFICTCNKCHLSDVMTLEEMRNHQCKK